MTMVINEYGDIWIVKYSMIFFLKKRFMTEMQKKAYSEKE